MSRTPLKAINIKNRVDIAKEFFWHVRTNFINQVEAGKHYNVPTSTISYMINGKQDLKAQMVEELGYELKYVKKETFGND